jgi:hypothetical protein
MRMRIRAGDWVYVDLKNENVSGRLDELDKKIAQVSHTRNDQTAVNLDDVTIRIMTADGRESFVAVPESACTHVLAPPRPEDDAQ